MAQRNDGNDLAILKDWRKSVDETLIGIKQDIKEGNENISKQITALDEKFAAKWVQTVVAGLVTAILIGFITVVINFFIPHNPTQPLNTTQTTPSSSSLSK